MYHSFFPIVTVPVEGEDGTAESRVFFVGRLDQVEHSGEGRALLRPRRAVEDPHLPTRRRRRVVRRGRIVLQKGGKFAA